jgi:hypothetical protein
MQFSWRPGFERDMKSRFSRAQAYIDEACIRHMDRYTPMRTGMLKKAATISTKIGSGRIEYASPYARYQYYGKLMVSSVTGSAYALSGEKKVLTNIDLVYNTASHPLAGPFWFERMKADNKDKILRGAASIMESEAKK